MEKMVKSIGTVLARQIFQFDALSRPTARTTSRSGCQPVQSSFSYNERSEVLSAAIGTNIFTHAYDYIGNHTLYAANGVTNAYEHNSLNQYAAVFDPAEPMTMQYALEYDIDGGMATDWEWDFEYDAADRLSSVSPTFPEDGALRVLNEFDYRNRRIRKIVQQLTITLPPPPSPPIETHTWNTIETRTFVYDDWNLIHETILEIDGGTTNVTEVQYCWGLDLSDTLHGAGGVGGLLAVSRNGQFYFPTYGNNGNVTKYIDESGNVVAAYEYDDFGRLISQSGPLAEFFRLRFSTKYYDPETGLYYYGERFYSPYWRIWLNRDPIEEEGGLNLYLICDNGTLCNIDMLGFNRYMTTFAFNWEQLHVGVAVDDWVCSGGKWKKNGVVTFDFAPQDNWWGRSMTYVGAAKGVIIESPGMTLQQHHVIFSSPEEDISMIKKIREEMKNPPRYNFFFNNCIKWALKAIEYGREYE